MKAVIESNDENVPNRVIRHVTNIENSIYFIGIKYYDVIENKEKMKCFSKERTKSIEITEF